MNINNPSVFFVTGVPKSGTTWMQMLLNSHQNIFCRPEDQFNILLASLPKFIESYNKIIQQTNDRTAKQKTLAYFDQSDVHSCFQFLVMRALSKYDHANSQIKAVGTKDNAIINNADVFIKLFPQAKFICVVRNPKDIAVSSWFHNLRVEDNFLKRSGGDLAVWARTVADSWGKSIKQLNQNFENLYSRLLWVRYEDLLSDTPATMEAVFNFLGISSNRSEIEKIVHENQFSRLAQGRDQGKENRNSFFRKGISGDWKNHLTAERWENATKNIRDIMQQLLYD